MESIDHHDNKPINSSADQDDLNHHHHHHEAGDRSSCIAQLTGLGYYEDPNISGRHLLCFFAPGCSLRFTRDHDLYTHLYVGHGLILDSLCCGGDGEDDDLAEGEDEVEAAQGTGGSGHL